MYFSQFVFIQFVNFFISSNQKRHKPFCNLNKGLTWTIAENATTIAHKS